MVTTTPAGGVCSWTQPKSHTSKSRVGPPLHDLLILSYSRGKTTCPFPIYWINRSMVKIEVILFPLKKKEIIQRAALGLQ